MRLSKLLTEELVLAGMEAADKEEAVEILLDLIVSRYPLLDRQKIAAAIAEREQIENTAYGRGFAFPHARTDAVERMYIALGVNRTPLRDQTPDGVPLRVICLMLTPSSISQLYLQSLSAFARFARNRDNIRRLLDTQTPTEIIDAVFKSGVKVDRNLLVRDIMVEKVITISPDRTLKDVANLLYKHRIGSLPVVDDDDKVVGMISNRDLVKAAMPDYKTLIENVSMSPDVEPFDEFLKNEDRITVGEMMEPDPATTTEDTLVVELAAMMIFKNLRRVPVVRDDKLVGIVVTSDLVSKIIRG
ncbi:MAG: PTS sugar transporter subunit IIA [candidate division Zixibacteria bacterium]|nr:PTS sugar transporter subunit IIA [candidate division Zixibacteria bacterium]